MVGDSVYNSTDEELAVITAYTSATTVTIDTTIDDDWDGDTIYILGHEFGLGGNATDARSLLRVGVKYDTDDNYFRTCEFKPKNKAFLQGGETYSQVGPIWYPTSVDISGTTTTAIGVLPEATSNIASGIEIEYIEQPSALSSDSDVPRLPLGSHSVLVLGGTAAALRKLMRLDEADRFEQMYQMERINIIASYQLTRGTGTPRVTPSRHLSRMTDRRI